MSKSTGRPVGRPPGTGGTPAHRRMAARIRDDFPGYEPVAHMAEGAIRLTEMAREDNSLWPEAVTAHEKVASFLTPKLKAIEISGTDGGPLRAVIASEDAKL